jgi:uncharacterized alpha-E superfamily protein
MDLPRSATVGWDPLLAIVGIDTSYLPPSRQATEETVVGHLASNVSNPSSVRASLAAVHRNLRVTRAVMPIEAVEVLTELHHHVQDTADQAVDRRTRGAWLTSVIRGCQTLSGILSETMSHDDAFCFFTVGRHLERADLTSRVLDVQAGVLTSRPDDALTPYAAICWSSALQSVCALESFRRRGRASSAEETIAFLLHDTKFPRSLESSLIQTSRWLLEIPGHETAMAACAEIGRLLQDSHADVLVEDRLHPFADEFQRKIAQLHSRIEASWFAPSHAVVG